MRTAFTRGPWSAHGNGWEVRACDGQMKVCDIRGWGYLTGKCALGLPDEQAIEIQKANECLIAAAPELYEALEELANLMNDVRSGNYRPDSFTTQPAEFALAKARGQTEPQEAPVSAQQAAGE